MSSPLKVMSFNIRFDTERDSPDHAWSKRRDTVAQILATYRPDLVGLQEAFFHQLADILERASGYRAVGRAREVGGEGEMVPILFDAKRLELLETGDFWLSITPEVEGSLDWDADNPRITTWAHFTDRDQGPFVIYNTHLDRWGEQARKESAYILIKKRAEIAHLPCLVTGDFNCSSEDEPFRILESGTFRDTYADIHKGTGPSTIHHYGTTEGRKIDFVLCDASWAVLGAEVITDCPGGCYPSDHYPVYAELVKA